MNTGIKALLTLCTSVLVLIGCDNSSQSNAQDDMGKDNTNPITIEVPAGQYKHDPTHSTFAFSVTHLGLADYVMRFTDYDIAVDLDPANLDQSSLTVTIDATGIDTDYNGDYQATHKQSSFKTWEEDLTLSPKFLNANEHPTITYKSTTISDENGKLKIDGNLTLLGQTHPVTLYAELTGQAAQHPFFGFGALGFSVTGTFERSKFGMTHLTNPPLVSDTVTIDFDGELHQIVEQK